MNDDLFNKTVTASEVCVAAGITTADLGNWSRKNEEGYSFLDPINSKNKPKKGKWRRYSFFEVVRVVLLARLSREWEIRTGQASIIAFFVEQDLTKAFKSGKYNPDTDPAFLVWARGKKKILKVLFIDEHHINKDDPDQLTVPLLPVIQKVIKDISPWADEYESVDSND